MMFPKLLGSAGGEFVASVVAWGKDPSISGRVGGVDAEAQSLALSRPSFNWGSFDRSSAVIAENT